MRDKTWNLTPETRNYKVCVRCATFNHASYITAAMDGFCIQQTDFPFICVIIDDASKDGEQQVIEQYLHENFILIPSSAHQDARQFENPSPALFQHKTNPNCNFVVYLLEENHYSQGKSPLIYANHWMEQADYVAQCEGDDYWTDPHKLQCQADALDATPQAVMVYTGYKCVGPNGEPVNRPRVEAFLQLSHSGDNLPTLLGYGNYVMTLTTMYRREVWQTEAYKNCPLKLDFGLTMAAALMGDFVWMPEVTACYRSLDSGMLKSGLQKGLLQVQEIYRYYARLILSGQCKPLPFSQRFKLLMLILKRAKRKHDKQLRNETLKSIWKQL